MTWLRASLGFKMRPQSGAETTRSTGHFARFDIHLDLGGLRAEGPQRGVFGVGVARAVALVGVGQEALHEFGDVERVCAARNLAVFYREGVASALSSVAAASSSCFFASKAAARTAGATVGTVALPELVGP